MTHNQLPAVVHDRPTGMGYSSWHYNDCDRCGDSADGKGIYQFAAMDEQGVRIGTTEEEYHYCQTCLEWMHEHYTVDAVTGNLEFPD